jgi:MFS family permease
MISLVLWLGIVSAPLGGVLSDHFKRPRTMLCLGCLLSAMSVITLAHSSAILLPVVALGVTIGLAPGAIMSLPARALGPTTRSVGMGVFFTIYYAAMTLGPVLAGASAKWHGNTSAALDLGAVALTSCPLLLLVFNGITVSGHKRADPQVADVLRETQNA